MGAGDGSSQVIGENSKGKERDGSGPQIGESIPRSEYKFGRQPDTDSIYERPIRRGTSFFVPLRKKGDEEHPWESKNILTFGTVFMKRTSVSSDNTDEHNSDGGGVRGYYSLLILQFLMKQVEHMEKNFKDENENQEPAYSSFAPFNEPPYVTHIPSNSENVGEYGGPRAEGSHFLPCHYFDYICGVSTGALISIMLSRLRMTVEDCLSEYENLGTAVFGKPRLFHQILIPVPGFHRTKYNSKGLQDAIWGVTSKRGGGHGDGTDRFRTEVGLCKVFVLAYKEPSNPGEEVTMQVPYIFRSYDHFRGPRNGEREHSSAILPRNGGSACMYNTWEVGRAATAAQAYFAPMKIWPDGDPPKNRRTSSKCKVFVDGGLGKWNNPASEVLKEVSKYGDPIGTFVSIGTGRSTPPRIQKSSSKIVSSNMAAFAHPEPPHLKMEQRAEENGFSYFRFNEPGALDMEFDEWEPRANGKRTLGKMEKAFNVMIREPANLEKLMSCAEELVRRRRLRADESSKWERFSLGAYFDCPYDGCPKRGQSRQTRFDDRREFDDHLLNDHGKRDERERHGIIEGSRGYWRYKQPPRVNNNGNGHV